MPALGLHLVTLARRHAVEQVAQLLPESLDPEVGPIATWHIYAGWGFICLWVLLLSSVRYTMWEVVGTLAMIESPTTLVLPAAANDLSEKTLSKNTDVLTIKQRPITSSIRSTLKHLTRRAGFSARWRGLRVAIYYLVLLTLTQLILSGIFTRILPLATLPIRFPYIEDVLAYILATILLSRLQASWTHAIIAEPSPKTWLPSILPNKDTKKLWKPAALLAIAEKVTSVGPIIALDKLRLHEATERSEIVSTCVLVGLLALVFAVGIQVPCLVTLVRVQASLLPDEYETIVPFDRTFGGKVVPEILGGTGAIGYLDAWRSFDRASRKRLLKVFAKFVAIEVAVHTIMGLLAAAVVALVFASGA